MGNKRRKDKVHDIGDSMPGTVGDSDGTIHDRQDIAAYNPESVTVPGESATHKSETSHNDSNTGTEHAAAEADAKDEDDNKTTRMTYAERYGDSWPEDRQRRFLKEHDITAREMGWTLRE